MPTDLGSLIAYRRAAGGDNSGSESEGEKRRASVQEVQVAGSAAARWQPLSEGISKVLSDAMLGALGSVGLDQLLHSLMSPDFSPSKECI